MRYRGLDSAGDYALGGSRVFLADSPETVAQAVKTRLALWHGEWFLDTTDGTPWNEQILGKRLRGRNYDAAIRQRILGTQGVSEISEYSSTFDGETRTLSVQATITTIYGTTRISTTMGA
jgi:hypothetical protein